MPPSASKFVCVYVVECEHCMNTWMRVVVVLFVLFCVFARITLQIPTSHQCVLIGFAWVKYGIFLINWRRGDADALTMAFFVRINAMELVPHICLLYVYNMHLSSSPRNETKPTLLYCTRARSRADIEHIYLGTCANANTLAKSD